MVEARLGGERSPGSAPASPTGPKAAEGSFPERLDPEVAPAPPEAVGHMNRSTRAGDRASMVLAVALLVALSLLFVPWSSVRSGLNGHGGHGSPRIGAPPPVAGKVPLAPGGGTRAGVVPAQIVGAQGF